MLQLAGIGAPRRESCASRAFFRHLAALLAMMLLLVGWQAAARAEAEFLDPEKAFAFSAQMVARPKPAPDLLLHCAEQFHVKPEHCVMIDDSSHGVVAANAAAVIAGCLVATVKCNI